MKSTTCGKNFYIEQFFAKHMMLIQIKMDHVNRRVQWCNKTRVDPTVSTYNHGRLYTYHKVLSWISLQKFNMEN